MKFAVIQFPSSNCDQDCLRAINGLDGVRAEYVWHKATSLTGFDAVVLPGGFAYGDYLRCGAIARFSPIMNEVVRAAKEGWLVLGTCNGFQVLCEAGLLPGALVRNRGLRFVCDIVRLRIEVPDSAFTHGCPQGTILRMPIAHGEGCYFGDAKTFVAIELLHWLRSRGIRAVGMKPICCGDREDARRLLAASAEGISIEELNPVWLQSPVAPSVAAQIEQVEIDLGRIRHCFRNLSERFDTVIVEGIGGWLVPITADLFVSDFAKQLELPVAIVAENRLGCLNHVLLTLESVQRRGLVCAGVILNQANGPIDLAQSTNKNELRRLLADISLVVIGEETEPNLAEIFAATEQLEVLRKLTQSSKF